MARGARQRRWRPGEARGHRDGVATRRRGGPAFSSASGSAAPPPWLAPQPAQRQVPPGPIPGRPTARAVRGGRQRGEDDCAGRQATPSDVGSRLPRILKKYQTNSWKILCDEKHKSISAGTDRVKKENDNMQIEAHERRGCQLPAAQGADRYRGRSPKWPEQPEGEDGRATRGGAQAAGFEDEGATGRCHKDAGSMQTKQRVMGWMLQRLVVLSPIFIIDGLLPVAH